MRIAIDLTALAFNFSGIERYALNIAYNIINLDTENEYILLFCNKVHEKFQALIDEKRVKTELVRSKNSKISKLMLFQVSVPRMLKKMKADKYVFLAFAPPIFFCEKGMIDTIHDIGYFDCPSMWRWYVTLYGKVKIRSALKHCERLVSVSEFTKNRLIEYFKYPSDKIDVIYNAIDSRFNNKKSDNEIEIRKKYNLPSDSFILCLATLEPRKNLKLLIRAYNNLIIEGSMAKKLVLAGRKGWKIDNLLEDISEKTRHNIIFTGFVDDLDLPDVYKLADTFVFPSIYEGFGIPPLESIACGTRTIVSDIDVFKEALGEAVIYFRNNDCESLQKQLIGNQLIEMKVMENQSNKYSWEISAQKYIEIICRR